jgi:hypothetical protein
MHLSNERSVSVAAQAARLNPQASSLSYDKTVIFGLFRRICGCKPSGNRVCIGKSPQFSTEKPSLKWLIGFEMDFLRHQLLRPIGF